MEPHEVEIVVELRHRSCGHTCTHSMWGEENLEDRKEALRNLPCHTCMDLNRVVCGAADGVYKRRKPKDMIAWLDSYRPNWRESVSAVRESKPAFGVSRDTRDRWLNRLLEEGSKV